MREYKVVLFGSGGVGKSAITVQFAAGRFVQNYNPTVEDVYRKDIAVNGEPAVVEVLDTAGTEQFASMRDLYIKNGEGFIVVYSICSRQSFKDVSPMRDQIAAIKRRKVVPIVLVGNKCDLENEREVPTDEGERMAQGWRCPFFEVSAKRRVNVDNVFSEAVHQIVRQRKGGQSRCVLL